MLDTFTILVTEKVECFQDCWDYSRELHYTKDWKEEQENSYKVELEVDNDGNILTTNTEIEKLLEDDFIVGKLINFEVLY